MIRAAPLALLAALAASGCINREPLEYTVQRPIHELRPPPETFEDLVSVTLYADEVSAYVEKMIQDGWGVLRHYPAAEAGTFIDDPVKPKVIVIFQRYKTKP